MAESCALVAGSIPGQGTNLASGELILSAGLNGRVVSRRASGAK